MTRSRRLGIALGLVLILSAAAAATAAPSLAIFIQFDGITADSEGGIEMLTFSFDGRRPVESCEAAARGAGSNSFEEIKVTFALDAATPKLLEAAGNGKPIDEAEINMAFGGDRCGIRLGRVTLSEVQRESRSVNVTVGYERSEYYAYE